MSKRKIMHHNFREQVKDDLKLIEENYYLANNNFDKPDFAFNFWVMDKLYNEDPELILDQITEYKDFAIDCFIHYEDTKELFIIQNKYYSEDTKLVRNMAADFLITPLSKLNSNTYTKNEELNNLFQLIKDDSEYIINFHFYLFNEKTDENIERLFTDFNLQHKGKEGKPVIQSKIFYFSDIYNKYYYDPYKKDKHFDFTISTNTGKMLMQVLPDQRDYELPASMIEAYYIMTPITDVYKMYDSALKKEYPIFQENIREYLGKSPINEGIKKTLENENLEERLNFFYYNNGITIICDSAKNEGRIRGKNPLKLVRPQVVNGCQTVNTIYEVLNNYAKKDPTFELTKEQFGNVFVMVKVLVKKKDLNADVYMDIVKYTNKQNALGEKAFASNKEEFSVLQRNLEDRGFLVLIQGSDKHSFEQKYQNKALQDLLTKANKYSNKLELKITKLSELFIPLESLLQVYLAFMLDGYYAYTKKPKLLKSNVGKTEINYYEKYSLKIQENLTSTNLINLWLLFKKAEKDRSKKEKVPIPYYVIGFLGQFLTEKEPNNISSFLDKFFDQKQDDILNQYAFLCDLTGNYKIEYKDKTGVEYNDMIKKEIESKILIPELNKLGGSRTYVSVKDKLERLQDK